MEGVVGNNSVPDNSVPDKLMFLFLSENYDSNRRRCVPEMPKYLWRRCKRIDDQLYRKQLGDLVKLVL